MEIRVYFHPEALLHSITPIDDNALRANIILEMFDDVYDGSFF
jgi:hypothetical protein